MLFVMAGSVSIIFHLTNIIYSRLQIELDFLDMVSRMVYR